MSKPGNYTAYQQYKPKDNGTIQALQHWSNFAQQKEQADKANKQKEKQLEYQANKDKQAEIDKWLSYDSIPATGVDNVDKFNAKIMASDQEALRKHVDELSSIDPNSTRGIELKTIIKNIQANPAKIKNIISAPLELAKKYTMGKGTEYVQTPENDAFFENLKNAKYTRNPETGEPAVIIEDPNDPKNTKILTEAEALNLQAMVPLIPKFNWEKLVKQNAEILNKKPPSKTEIDPKTGYLVTTEGYQPETIESIASSLFMDDNGKPTEYAISFLAQKGIHDIKDLPYEKLQELEQQFVTDITPFLVSKEGIKTNTNKIQEQKLAQKTANDNAKLGQGWAKINLKSQELIGTGKIQVKPNPDVDFVTKSNQKGKPTFGVNIAENKFSIINQNKDVTVEQQIRDITIDPNTNGKVMINGTVYEETPGDLSGKKPTKTDFSFDSSNAKGLAQVEKVAAHLGLNRQQLYDLIKARIPKAKPSVTKPKAKRKASDYGI